MDRLSHSSTTKHQTIGSSYPIAKGPQTRYQQHDKKCLIRTVLEIWSSRRLLCDGDYGFILQCLTFMTRTQNITITNFVEENSDPLKWSTKTMVNIGIWIVLSRSLQPASAMPEMADYTPTVLEAQQGGFLG